MATPENVPEMMTECPVCMEPLFDNEGIIIEDKEIAKIMCCHLVHSDCLRKAGLALNSDGSRYGIGGFGARAGCPVCAEPVSMWVCHKEASEFPIFWMKRILDCLEKTGPQNGPVPVEKVREALEADPDLTAAQKKGVRMKNNSGFNDIGFPAALKEGSHRWDGRSFAYKDYVWRWDETKDTLWLNKWGAVPMDEATTSTG